MDPGKTDSNTLHGVADDCDIPGVGIGRQWLAMSGVRVIDHDNQPEVVSWRVHRVPIAQHHDRRGLEGSQILRIPLGRGLIAREQNQGLLGGEFAQRGAEMLNISPIGTDNDDGAPLSKDGDRDLCERVNGLGNHPTRVKGHKAVGQGETGSGAGIRHRRILR